MTSSYGWKILGPPFPLQSLDLFYWPTSSSSQHSSTASFSSSALRCVSSSTLWSSLVCPVVPRSSMSPPPSWVPSCLWHYPIWPRSGLVVIYRLDKMELRRPRPKYLIKQNKDTIGSRRSQIIGILFLFRFVDF
uniref:Uncharacterized protein n=1 Tax=Cacopsylla melanoneura TaxID=428564 RepID=A0A8D8XZC1_9HEMI